MITKIQESYVGVTAVTVRDVVTAGRQPFYARYFFVAMAGLFIVITSLGFWPSYRDNLAGTFPIHWVAHVHGVIMSSWLLVFLTQALLAASGQLKYHRQLGLASVGLGVLVWIMMGVAYVRLMIANRPPVEHFFYDLLLLEFDGLATFGGLFAWGVLARKNAAAHKRLILLATLVITQAAIDRIHWLPQLGIGYPYVDFLYLDALIIPLFAYDLFTVRHIHRFTWIGSAWIVVSQLVVSWLWGSPAWHKFWFSFFSSLWRLPLYQ